MVHAGPGAEEHRAPLLLAGTSSACTPRIGAKVALEQIERYWCPLATSADLVGGAALCLAQVRRSR